MFRNVLVGVDGGYGGRDAMALARRLMDAGGQMTLVHVYSDWVPPIRVVAPAEVASGREDSDRLLEQERAAAGVDAEALSVGSGQSPGAVLHERAEEQEADLLVVGSCSRGALGRAVLGDDTRAALNGAPCAVAIAAKGYAADPRPVRKIGVGYNESQESRTALTVAHEIATATGGEVHALEVVSLPSYAFTTIIPPLVGENLELMVSETAARLDELQGVQGRAVYGIPGEELAVFSEDMDLLVVGSRGYGPVRRLIAGSTSSYLERHTRCSLLVLARTAPEPIEGPETPSAGRSATQPGSTV